MNPENQNGYTLQPKSSLLQSISILFIFLLNVPWSWRKKRCEFPGILDIMHKCANKKCMYFCVNLMNTNNTKFNNKKTFRKHCYNIKISIHIMNTYFCTDVCAKWSSKRTQCPVSKTHAPSLRESFACSDTTEIKYQPIIPMYCSASSACADSAVDSNPMIRCLSCGTTNNTKHPIVQRNFLPACQAVAIGPAANSMHAHVRLAVCQASSVPSARLRACYRNPICRLSGNPSVGVSS